jgi:hypothetical protein
MKVMYFVLVVFLFSAGCDEDRLSVDIPPGATYIVFPQGDSLKFTNSIAYIVKDKAGDTTRDTVIFNGDTTVLTYHRGPRPKHEDYTAVQASGIFPNHDMTTVLMAITRKHRSLIMIDSAYFYMFDSGEIHLADNNTTQISGIGNVSLLVEKRPGSQDNLLCDISPCSQSDSIITVKVIFNAVKQ